MTSPELMRDDESDRHDRVVPSNCFISVVSSYSKEPNQMFSPRWLVRLTIPVLAGAALAGSAAVATATPAQDSAYLAKLSAVGLTWPQNADEALIGEAHLICYDLTWGWQPQTIADDIHDHLNKRGVTLLDVGTMVDAAHKIYCPGNVCDAPTLCT